LNIKPQFLSSINFTGTVLGFQISPQKETENSIQVSMQVRKLELHILNQSNIQDNFWTATGALHDWNVVELCHAETTCKDAY
jgi:hypothetical protein